MLSIETKMLISGITGGNKDAIEQLIQLMTLPDEVFDKSFEQIKSSIEEAYKNQGIQKEMLQILMENPSFDVKEEKENIKNILDEIDNLEDLTANKKEVLKIAITSATEELFNLANNPREKINVKVKKLSRLAKLPTYAHPTDAGADIYSLEKIVIEPHTTTLVKTGIAVSMPAGYMIQIYPRSGLSAKTTLRVANSVGLVDHLYNKEICVIMENTGNSTQTIEAGDRIAQMLIMPVPMIKWEEVEQLDDSGREGFGSSGR